MHEFFVDWFTGRLDESDAVFARCAAALHPEFAMVVPSGEVLDRNAVVTSVRAAHSTAGDAFAIDIRSVVSHLVDERVVLVTYEEWQSDEGRLLSRRTSTAAFVPAPDAPNGVQWRHLHETYHHDQD